jgi:membrane dipeptidase
VTEAPVIFSHSDSRALVDVARNVPDSILRRLPKNGGVVMVTFVPSFVSQASLDHGKLQGEAERQIRKRLAGDTAAIKKESDAWKAANPAPIVTVSQVIDHIEHMRQIVGVDHIGIGGDFDGITDTVQGLDDVSKYPELFAELAHRGWSDDDMRKLAGQNVLRVFEQVEQVAARLQKTRQPSTKTILELDGKK